MPVYKISYYDHWAKKRDSLKVYANSKRAAIKHAQYTGTSGHKAKLLPRFQRFTTKRYAKKALARMKA